MRNHHPPSPAARHRRGTACRAARLHHAAAAPSPSHTPAETAAPSASAPLSVSAAPPPLTRERRAGFFFASLVGGGLFGVGYAGFLLPCAVVTGGAAGIATTLHALFRLPPALSICLFNLPLLLWQARAGGRQSLLRAGWGILLTALATEACAGLPPLSASPLAGAVCGGLLMGAGVGVLLSRDITTGGTDLLAALWSRKHPRVSAGKAVFVLDVAVILLSAAALRRAEGLLASAVCTLAYSLALDFAAAHFPFGYVKNRRK